MKNSKLDTFILDREFAKYIDIIPGFIHNLNTPLMNISGRVELLQYKNPELTGTTEILQQMDRINDMVTGLRYIIEKDKSMKPERLNLTDFFNKLHSFLLFNLQYKHKIKVTRQIDEKLTLKTIPFNLLNIIYEILLNCIRNVLEGGTILIRAYPDGDKAVFEITRNGISVSEAELERLNSELENKDIGENMSGYDVVKYLTTELNGTIEVKNQNDEVQYTVVIPNLP